MGDSENWYVLVIFRFSTQEVKKSLFGNLQNCYQCEDYESNPEVQSYIDKRISYISKLQWNES